MFTKEKKEKPVIEERDVQILQEKLNQSGKTKTVIRLLRWCVDGTAGAMVLEKRMFNLNQKGEFFTGKSKGFTKEDLDMIFSQWDDLKLAFES